MNSKLIKASTLLIALTLITTKSIAQNPSLTAVIPTKAQIEWA